MKKKLIIIFLSILTIFLIIISFISNLLLQNNKKQSSLMISNTKISPKTKEPMYQITTKNWQVIPDFTGVSNPPLSDEENKKNQQISSLRQKLPFKNEFFSLDFDYNNYIFIVNLKKPEEESKKIFFEWLKNNYPYITVDQFLIK